jgi:hypothetical protein
MDRPPLLDRDHWFYIVGSVAWAIALYLAWVIVEGV